MRGDGLLLTKCPVCNADNLDFSVRCISCGSYLQQNVRTLDLFSTLFNLWRYPDFTLRRIVLATHRNYTILLAILEAVGLSFLFLFVVKAADIYSVELPRLLNVGVSLAVIVFLPSIYLISALNYLIVRLKRTGASFKGFASGIIYSLHPIAVSAIIFLPTGIAVFGAYLFSNNPSPQVINPLPFYFLGFLDFVFGTAPFFFVVRLTQVLFGSKILVAAFAAISSVVLFTAFEVAKYILLKW